MSTVDKYFCVALPFVNDMMLKLEVSVTDSDELATKNEKRSDRQRNARHIIYKPFVGIVRG